METPHYVMGFIPEYLLFGTREDILNKILDLSRTIERNEKAGN